MKRERRKFTAKFKTMVALEAIREQQSLPELASRFNIHPTQISNWDRAFLEGPEHVFAKNSSKDKKSEKELDQLYQKIGKLEVEKDFLKKSLGEICPIKNE